MLNDHLARANEPPTIAENRASCPINQQALTAQERQYAQVAWQYFRDNMQPQTGLVNSVERYPSTSLWDMGNSLMALHAARSLNLIDQADFDYRLNQFLQTLGTLPLVDRTLPNKAYNTATAKMVDYENQPSRHGIGWSAIDIGRLLAALHIVQDCHPRYQDWIRGVVSKWQLQRAIDQGQLIGAIRTTQRRQLVQEGRLGYEEYAALGFDLWGFTAPKALDRRAFRKFVEIYGIQIPVDQRTYATTNASNYVVSESYILQRLEFGGDPEFAATAAKILAVQQRRYEKTGILTALSEDHVKGKPHFLYNTIYANGISWATITEDNQAYAKLRSLSTKAAFGWHYLYPDNDYAQRLFDVAKTLKPATAAGFYAGQFERNQMPNQVLTANTNGLILECLLYKAQGYQPLTRSAQRSGRASSTAATTVMPVVNHSAATSALPEKTGSVTASSSSDHPPSRLVNAGETRHSVKPPVLLGAYSQRYLGEQAAIDQDLHGISQWAGKRLSLAGLFFDLEDENPSYNIPRQLEKLHQNGLTAFLNFSARHPAAKLANGDLDRQIQQIAQAFATWAKQGGQRMAFLAPLPEMNGAWEPYGEDPANFKRAYQRIQRIFTEAGVPSSAVRWTFAPNGWSPTQQHKFEHYYPGDAAVDVVAFSGYNWGHCQYQSWKQWDSPDAVFGPYLQRLRVMAPDKLIVIAQTASTSTTSQGENAAQKDQWLRDSYRYLAASPAVQGILYFNLQKECDWPIYTPKGPNSQGFKDAVAHDAFAYRPPGQLRDAGF
ncbi:DUF3131 domain-containing protein [filamentous cyanobacterium LEGE 11480]|uniref:DUF3131 domain-containing protein n=1 Tax=Romeriopsis navalis LEGE 11480 TaxID=2777977 RepID=A0A928VN83_9CYAN|nr:DUF3131 domain-containing protein [Romeriopsis navalis]MBE9029801.1 DUF3131 domain-containing protein [Romeriopsis navalis LEGE 11480]